MGLPEVPSGKGGNSREQVQGGGALLVRIRCYPSQRALGTPPCPPPLAAHWRRASESPGLPASPPDLRESFNLALASCPREIPEFPAPSKGNPVLSSSGPSTGPEAVHTLCPGPLSTRSQQSSYYYSSVTHEQTEAWREPHGQRALSSGVWI